ncbi:KDPG and KHG aldolase subfamily [[Clostridium] ultunense Esp]|nr:KDPG and KHG aldolase subfamily [[Clostridium] ultunense Esp]
MNNMKNPKIISIIRDVEPEIVDLIVDVLLDEGINWVEVSLSNEELGLQCIKKLSEKHDFNELKLGVGTVTNCDQVDKAIDAGAKYIITPAWDTQLVRYVKSKDCTIIPGVFSPSDVMNAQNEGINVCKLFPANLLGLDYIKSLKGPFPNMKFIAVGGIGVGNMLDFVDKRVIGYGVGGELVPRGATIERIDEIRANARNFMKLLK